MEELHSAEVAAATFDSTHPGADPLMQDRLVIAAKLSCGGLLTVSEAASFLAVHAETIRRALRRGRLRGVRPPNCSEWRILPTDLSQYVGVPLSVLATNAQSQFTQPTAAPGGRRFSRARGRMI
jgi:excisionase family DNA binding protein